MPYAPPQAGTTIAGRYVLDRLLGSGSFGQVWAAHDTHAFNRTVAVKVLLEQHLQNAEVVARFKREARATAALTHPNVVTLVEFGQEDGVPYLVSEFVAGRALRDELDARDARREFLAVDDVRAVFRQICAGVAAAHAAGIIHRDLKPENVMVDGAGASVRVKVLDFGIARMVAPDSYSKDKTETGRVMGSFRYMAPEQVLGDVERISERTDVFALTAVLYELLTLKRAFDGDAVHEVVAKILQGPRPAPTALRPELPPAVDDVIRRGLALAPEARIASVDALLAEAEHALAQPAGPEDLSEHARASGTVDVPGRTNAPAAAPDAKATPWERTSALPAEPGGRASLPYEIPLVQKRARGPRHRGLAAVGGAVGLAGLVLAAHFATRARTGANAAHTSTSAPDARVASDPTPARVPPREDPTAAPPAAARRGDPPPAPPDDPARWARIETPAPLRLGRASEAGDKSFSPRAGVTFAGPPFALHRREVTFGEYEAWAATQPPARAARPPSWVPQQPEARAQLPVVNVAWPDARAYCQALGGDLPSEEQWEYAARGPRGRANPWRDGARAAQLAAFRGPDGQLAPVGSTPADQTPEGVLDLAGNAQEWTSSRYRQDDGTLQPWTETERVAYKAIRGLPLREARRTAAVPPAGTYRNAGCVGDAGDRTARESVGFRCARPLPR